MVALDNRIRDNEEEVKTAGIWDALRLERVCEQSQLAWVRVGYLREHGRTCQGHTIRYVDPLPRRQDLPSDALVVGAPTANVTCWIVSHPWLAKQHPDVDGQQLAMLLEKLDRNGANDTDLVFYDYFSMYQRGWEKDDRTEPEKRLFSVSLKAINTLYTTPGCKVIVLPVIPKSAGLPHHHFCNPALKCPGVMLETNPRPYAQRGWCWFELLI